VFETTYNKEFLGSLEKETKLETLVEEALESNSENQWKTRGVKFQITQHEEETRTKVSWINEFGSSSSQVFEFPIQIEDSLDKLDLEDFVKIWCTHI
jgi:hypothetical protein